MASAAEVLDSPTVDQTGLSIPNLLCTFLLLITVTAAGATLASLIDETWNPDSKFQKPIDVRSIEPKREPKNCQTELDKEKCEEENKSFFSMNTYTQTKIKLVFFIVMLVITIIAFILLYLWVSYKKKKRQTMLF